MNPRRFIILFIIATAIGLSSSFFFAFAARILQDSRIVFIPFVSNILFTFLFSWLYFKKIPTASWRFRLEAIGVWFGLMLLVDSMVLYLILKRAVTDLTTFSLVGYSLTIMALCVAAYVSKDSKKQITSPNLKLG
jgi:hypothetical protein